MRESFPDPIADIPLAAASGSEAAAVLAGGCFWCVEAVYLQLDGVASVVSGYAGGTRETANYEAVCSGTTGHAEAVRIRYDPSRITYGQILKVFFYIAHDPTQLNAQGADRGTQYRSAIFYEDAQQKDAAAAYIRQLDAARVFPAPIVTTLEPLTEFYEAEPYHQNYAARHPSQPYVAYVAAPKVEKLRARLPDRLKRGHG
ncbi:MAG: peptide-methionine (S)-S-oxide reductase MsrA [Acidobacteria bacterium]|nr:peptide-methionine (S)-S-oxide reductase MsrA [Acidobacteriota bacterium]